MSPGDSGAAGNRLIGVRGKLVFSLLIIVILSMWILGLSLMQLMKSSIANQLTAKAGVIASSIESVIEVGQERQYGLITGGRGVRFPLGRLLQSYIADVDIAALTVLDNSGRIIASASPPPEKIDSLPPDIHVVDISLGPNESGLLKIRFSRESQRRQTALSLMRIIIQLAITALTLIVLINIMTSVTVLTPIRKLLFATERIGGGDLSATVDAGGQDEFGDLGRSFNNMLARLRGSEGRNRNQLESLRQAHTDLQAKEKQLVQSEKMAAVGRVAAGVAHEVGNPLGSVTGYLAMLRGESLAEGEKNDYLLRMEQEIGRINRIMLDLLNYARPPRPELSEIDLNILLREITGLLGSQGDFAGTTIVLETVAEAPTVRGDLHRVRQMFVNILLNAAQAMPEGGTITIASALGEKGASLTVSIRDEGPGIPEEDLPRIFDPFFTSGKRGRGSGLGLALCQQIAASAGAAIEVDSTPGKGATFKVVFPL